MLSQKSFLEQWLPRILAVILFGYLMDSLFSESLAILHIWILAFIVVLILAPMASRLKLMNWIDFSSKLDSLDKQQTELKEALVDIKNSVSNVFDARVNPVQHQTMVLTTDVFKELTEIGASRQTAQDIPDAKQEFLRRAYQMRIRARVVLGLAYVFQIAMIEHRIYGEKDYIEGETFDERNSKRLKKILENGLETLLPTYLVHEETGEMKALPLEEIGKKLLLLDKIATLREKVEVNEIELPEREEIEELFEQVGDAITDLTAGIMAIGSHGIISAYRINQLLEELKEEVE